MSDSLSTLPDARTTRTLPFGRLLDQAVDWSRRYLKTLVLPYGTVIAVLTALLATAQAASMQVLYGGDSGLATSLVGCVVPVLAFAVLGVQYLVVAALGVAATDAVAGREVSVWGSLRFLLTLPRIATLILAGVLAFVAYVCCIVPILYVGPLLSFVVPAMAEENVVGGEAISRSVALARHNPGRRFVSNPLVKALALLIVAVLISVLLSLATSAPFQIAQQWMTFRDAGLVEGGGMPPLWIFWVQVPASVISAFISTAAWLYGAFGFALLYFDTRKRKEGMDLEAAMTELDRERRPRDEAPAPESPGGPGLAP